MVQILQRKPSDFACMFPFSFSCFPAYYILYAGPHVCSLVERIACMRLLILFDSQVLHIT